jgi:hypothetical protein
MAYPPFDPSHSVKFDLGRGRVELGDSIPRLLIPADALLQLCRSASVDAQRDFGHRLGNEAGRRAASRLVGGAAPASIEAVVDHLGGDFALLGIGSFGIERWGKALVVTLTDSPLGAEGDELCAAMIEGAMQRALGRDGRAVGLGRNDGVARFAVLGRDTAAAVRRWLSAGTTWTDALARLNRPRGRA